MKEYQSLFAMLGQIGAEDWVKILPEQLRRIFAGETHGDLARWQQVVAELPVFSASSRDLSSSVRIGCDMDLTDIQRQDLRAALMKLHPWRKGPFSLFGVEIDSEWRSDWKWDRLKNHISPLKNKLVLDVGCGNGYHCWRMLGAEAKLVIGIDPTLLSVMQFQSIQKLYGEAANYVLPLGIEDIPKEMRLFDTVFSMGVLYHRRSPIDHLLELKGCLRSGGELVLETLVVEGGEDRVLMPSQRYAQMRNVWFLPSCDALRLWMMRCGYKNIRLVDIAKTNVDEQRSTEWMRFHSLRDFLSSQNNALTCEGLPAPMRAIFIADID